MTNALEGIRELTIQKLHLMLQIQELLVKQGLLQHGNRSRFGKSGTQLKLQLKGGFLYGKKSGSGKFLDGQAETHGPVHRSVIRASPDGLPPGALRRTEPSKRSMYASPPEHGGFVLHHHADAPSGIVRLVFPMIAEPQGSLRLAQAHKNSNRTGEEITGWDRGWSLAR